MGTEGDTGDDGGGVEIWNLPDHVMLRVFRLVVRGTEPDVRLRWLRLVAARVCRAWRDLARAPELWRGEKLRWAAADFWDDEVRLRQEKRFATTLLFLPCLTQLELTYRDGEGRPVLFALEHSRCRIDELLLDVEEYDEGIVRFLEAHPEIKSLELRDILVWKDRADALAGSIATSQTTSLNLDASNLLRVGGLASLEKKHNLETLSYCPAEWRRDNFASYCDASEVGSLAQLIVANRDSLRSVSVTLAAPAVFEALAACSRLRSVSASCGGALGVGLPELQPFLSAAAASATLQALTLCHIPDECSDDVLRQVNQMKLKHLHLNGCSKFSGPLVLLPLLQSLETLQLTDVSFFGRDEVETLAAVKPLSLKTLTLSDCPCSATGSYALCRDRAWHRMDSAHPETEIVIDNSSEFNPEDDLYDYGFMPIYDCQCERD